MAARRHKREKDLIASNVTQPKKNRNKAVVRVDRSRRHANLPRKPRNIKNKQTADDETDDQMDVWLAIHGMRYLVQGCSVNRSVSRTVFIVHSVNDLLCFMVWT